MDPTPVSCKFYSSIAGETITVVDGPCVLKSIEFSRHSALGAQYGSKFEVLDGSSEKFELFGNIYDLYAGCNASCTIPGLGMRFETSLKIKTGTGVEFKDVSVIFQA